MKATLWLSFVLWSCAGASAAPTNAWERTDAYVAPNFAGFFADDPEAGARLDDLNRSGSLDRLTPQEMTLAIQKGLRRSKAHTLNVLRTFGNRLIWGRQPQDAAAIELMYHASAAPLDLGTGQAAYWAVYFGLSVTEPKTPNLLRTLTEIGMRSDDPNMLSRVAWGVRTRQPECLAYLKPFQESKQESVRAKARLVERILTGELDAFAWATDQARQRAQANYSRDLPEMKHVLSEGSSPERRQVLDKIQQNRIELIMDDSFIPALATCARDVDGRVRNQVIVIAGQQWIWSAKEQNPAVIELMLQLSYDPEPEVRYNAVYYGLSTVRDKSDAVVRRLLEMAFHESERSDLPGRIGWGLMLGRRTMPPKAVAFAAEYLRDPDPRVAALAAGWYRSYLHSIPPTGGEPGPAATPGTDVVREIRSRLQPRFQPFVLRLEDGQALLITQSERVALGEQLLVLVEPEDRVRTVPVRQIREVNDVPPK